MGPQLLKITDVSKYPEAGLPWKTLHQARWAYRKRHEYGIAGAFVRLGSTINIDVPRFHELARSIGANASAR
ncbi:MAG: hypothetical protein ACLQFF_12405 [Steroidobacteraceae bacterium]|jgi:hypothetical protein